MIPMIRNNKKINKFNTVQLDQMSRYLIQFTTEIAYRYGFDTDDANANVSVANDVDELVAVNLLY